MLILILQRVLHFRKGVISETFQGLDRSFFWEPKELGDLVGKGNLIHRFFPKQADIDKILKVVHRKMLKGTHLLVEIKEIQATYLHISYFKGIYIYIYHKTNYLLPKQQLEK